MAARRSPTALLADQLLSALLHLKDSSVYPPTLGELARAAGVEERGDTLAKAVAPRTSFGQSAVVVQAKILAMPVALQGDEALLLGHDKTLLALLEMVCNSEKPTVEVSKLRPRIPASLRSIWDGQMRQRFERQSLPEGVAAVQSGKKALLHLVRYPLPLPPEELLARQWLEHLAESRRDGLYPTTLGELQHRLAAPVSPAIVKKALASPHFKNAVVFAMKVQASTPVAFSEDADQLASSDVLLVEALRQARSGVHHAVTLADLKKKVARELQARFADALTGRWESGTMPARVGCLLQRKSPLFFLLEDLIRGPLGEQSRDTATSPVRQDVEVRKTFEEAFQELDRARGGHNFVSLVDLRDRVSLERRLFDQMLHDLRREGKYTLSAAEGRHGLSAEEQQAALREDGVLLLYVSRKR